MIINTFLGYEITCDKCSGVIRNGIVMMTKQAVRQLQCKNRFCGNCIQERLRRDDTKKKT